MKINKLGLVIIAAFLAFMALVALTSEAKAQDKAPDTGKAYVTFINGSYDHPIVNNWGVGVGAQVKLYSYQGVKLEAVGDFSGYTRSYYNVYTYLAGPQVSVDLFHNRLTPFARIMFGATRYDERTFYAHSIGGGVDVNVTKRFFVRPFSFDKQSTDMNGQPTYRLGVGGGFRF